MRQNIIIALLTVCATLLAVQVVSDRASGPDSVSTAYGQGVGNTATAPYILATGMSQQGSNNMLYIFDATKQKLAAYTVKNRGIEYQGTRLITYDLIPEELTPRGTMKVSDVRKATRKSN